MSSLDLDVNDLQKIIAQLHELNKSSLDVEMIKVAGCRVRLKSTPVEGQRDSMSRQYQIMSFAREDERPPGGTLRG